jgi:hypothetical protein
MPVGWNFPYVITTVVDADGVAPIHLVIGKILYRKLTTSGLHERCDLLGQSSAIETLGVRFSNSLQRVGVSTGAPDFTGQWCTLGRKSIEPLAKVRLLELAAKQPGGLLPSIGHHGRNRKTSVKIGVVKTFYMGRNRF